MRAFITLCLVAFVMGHPVNEANEDSKHVQVKRDLSESSGDNVQKREIVMNEGDEEEDCSQLSGDALQACNEKRVKRGADMQPDGNMAVDGSARQDDNIQEAWSNEGAYARQGEGGQFVSASDFGGPIVQILQHVYKANCCECGCNCGCPGEGGEGGEDPDHDLHDPVPSFNITSGR